MSRRTTLALVLSLTAPACSGPVQQPDAAGTDGAVADHDLNDPRDVTVPTDTVVRDVPTGADAPPDAPPVANPNCDPLPAPTGMILRVDPSRVAELPSIVRGAPSGATIVLANGTYTLRGDSESARRLVFAVPGVTLRSESNDAARVIIDGAWQTNEIAYVTASNVTLAHVTLTHAVDHPIHATPPEAGPSVTGLRVYGVHLVDNGEQFLKANPNGARSAFVDEGVVECSLFRMSDEGRPHVERNPGGCYTGGIDVHAGRAWQVRRNRFVDLYCAGEGLAEHAVHFWVGSRDTLVEQNVIINCARAVGFGLVESGDSRAYPDDPYPGVGFIGHYDGVIRNNGVFASVPWFDTGIELAQARGARVLHNTIVSVDSATGFFSSIDYRYDHTQVTIQNNLVRRITVREGAMGTVDHNLENVPATHFADAPYGDFHLNADATDAIDRGITHPEAGADLDGDPHSRGAAPDLGADER